jgi:hypothetical protein
VLRRRDRSGLLLFLLLDAESQEADVHGVAFPDGGFHADQELFRRDGYVDALDRETVEPRRDRFGVGDSAGRA